MNTSPKSKIVYTFNTLQTLLIVLDRGLLIRIPWVRGLVSRRSQWSLLRIRLISAVLARRWITLWRRLIVLLGNIVLRYHRLLVRTVIRRLVWLSIGLWRGVIRLWCRSGVLYSDGSIRNGLVRRRRIRLRRSWRRRLSCLRRNVCDLWRVSITRIRWRLICSWAIRTARTRWLLNVSNWRIIRREILWLRTRNILCIHISWLVSIRTILILLICRISITGIRVVRIGHRLLMAVTLTWIWLVWRWIHIATTRSGSLAGTDSVVWSGCKILIILTLVLNWSILLWRQPWNFINRFDYHT